MRLPAQIRLAAPAVRQLLYIDDDRDDVDLTQHACQRIGAPFAFHIARSSEEAISMLEAALSHGSSSRPDLILLELLLKTGSAFEVLEYIQSQPQLSQIPLVLYTGAMDPDLLARAEKLGATSVLPKGSYAEIAQRLSKFISGLNAKQPTALQPFRPISTTDENSAAEPQPGDDPDQTAETRPT